MDKEVRVACRVLQHIRRRATKLPKVTALWTLGLMVPFRPMSCDVMRCHESCDVMRCHEHAEVTTVMSACRQNMSTHVKTS